MRCLITSVTMVVALAGMAAAQNVHGVVRDSANGVGIRGAVLMVLDSSRALLGRNIANEHGEFRLDLSGHGQQIGILRFVRIGFRPREVPIVVPAAGTLELDVRMAALPTMLEPVRIRDQPKCPQRSDRAVAFALWEQAQTGLLATVVARESNPAAMLRIGFQRRLDASGDGIVVQRVHVDSSDRATVSFRAARTAADFVRLGFRDTTSGPATFLGPDAEVLLDDAFLAGYCVRVADADRARPNQVGLAFEAVDHRRDRVDIAGTVWIDTAARALRDIDYRYVGLDRRSEALRPGGQMEFREMPNGIVLLDRWNLRLVGFDSATVRRRTNMLSVETLPFAEEAGGELARAAWPDGTTWNASLGSVRAHVERTDGTPAAGATVRLSNTDYRATADSSGDLVISNLVPGPYSMTVAEPRLGTIGVAMTTNVVFVAARDSVVQVSPVIPTLEDVVGGQCRSEDRLANGDSTWLLVRVMTADGLPVPGIRVSLREQTEDDVWVAVGDDHVTGVDGLFTLCRGLRPHANVIVQARGESDRADVAVQLAAGLTVARVTLRPTKRAPDR